jgi:protein required for attachment to host cells
LIAARRSYSSSRIGVRHAVELTARLSQDRELLLRLAAQALDEASQSKALNRLILVASRRSLGELRGQRISREIPKDLTPQTAAGCGPSSSRW